MIALTTISNGTADKKINWNDFIKELKVSILENYDNSPFAKYKGAWKHAFKKIDPDPDPDRGAWNHWRSDDEWESIIGSYIQEHDQQSSSIEKASNTPSSPGPQLSRADTSSKATSTSSLNYQRELTVADKVKVSENFKKVNKKWVLNSGTTVEDMVYMTSKEFSYEQ